MKQKVLAIAGCIAATAPSASIADVLPEKFVGLNLGEIRSSSFLNQPFKGVIPFLFTNYENSKNLNVSLAPQSIFDNVGAEKHPILNSLNFQVMLQDKKPVILISSDQPINLPFLNFILEIKGPGTLVYQDYTVLLDPVSKQKSITTNADYIDVRNDEATNALYKEYKKAVSNKVAATERTLKESGSLLLANLSSETSTNSQNRKYTVKRGDSLSKIAQRQKFENASLKVVSKLIYQKNPKAFVRGNVNRLKKGAVLTMPTAAEVKGFEIAKRKPVKPVVTRKTVKKDAKPTTTVAKTTTEKPKTKPKNTYVVAKGDSLSKITKKFGSKDISFTKMMDSIYNNNPTAFINKSKNRLKAGATLKIPSFEELKVETKQEIVKKEEVKTQAKIAKASSSKPQVKNSNKANQEKPLVQNKSVKLKKNQYQVKEGDTLTSVTNNIGYKEVPFAQMLKGIFDHNPDAFVKGKMTSLAAGAIITLPSLESIAKNSKETKQKQSEKVVKKTQGIKKPAPTIVTAKNNKQVVAPDLTKRIRELRKELQQAKENLAELKGNLSNKEILLEQKNIQLNSLNTMLTKYDKAIDSDTLAAIAVKTKTDKTLLEQEIDYKPKSKAEMAKLKRELFNRSEKTKSQITKLEELANKTSKIATSSPDTNNKGDNLNKENGLSSLLDSSNSNYAYLVLALLLSLLLIRYRRALYSYTYSKINIDEPKYYPLPDADKYDLKEKNINFHDPKMDEDPTNYDFLTEAKEESSVTINPILVEATEEIFNTSEEARQIEHCEHLVTELFDDLDQRDNEEKESEWNDIEKFCDSYIDKIKDTDINNDINDSDKAIVNEATDFNDMMSDLLESLEKVDKSVKRNNQYNEDFPDVLKQPKNNTTDKHPLI